ncbi:MAG: type II toxin-antitoxin system RelE/ParE family toxin [Candidatus Aenigmarchaeota archaeon]|nr:type II toxin-antitoxin system RelE/ParE family toxin [Candidatus Aenigmarchaeota archaeon]
MTNGFDLIFTKQAATFIENLDRGYREKLKEIFTQLRDNPFSYPYKKVRGYTNLYRIRLGRYRILYELERDPRRIIVLKIETRGKIYK